jgi:hypothetical protein
MTLAAGRPDIELAAALFELVTSGGNARFVEGEDLMNEDGRWNLRLEHEHRLEKFGLLDFPRMSFVQEQDAEAVQVLLLGPKLVKAKACHDTKPLGKGSSLSDSTRFCNPNAGGTVHATSNEWDCDGDGIADYTCARENDPESPAETGTTQMTKLTWIGSAQGEDCTQLYSEEGCTGGSESSDCSGSAHSTTSPAALLMGTAKYNPATTFGELSTLGRKRPGCKRCLDTEGAACDAKGNFKYSIANRGEYSQSIFADRTSVDDAAAPVWQSAINEIRTLQEGKSNLAMPLTNDDLTKTAVTETEQLQDIAKNPDLPKTVAKPSPTATPNTQSQTASQGQTPTASKNQTTPQGPTTSSQNQTKAQKDDDDKPKAWNWCTQERSSILESESEDFGIITAGKLKNISSIKTSLLNTIDSPIYLMLSILPHPSLLSRTSATIV